MIISIINVAYPQPYNLEIPYCNKSNKVNKFCTGDTLYSSAYYDKWGNNYPYDSCFSPLLDSLCVSLLNQPDIIVIINSSVVVPKESFYKWVTKLQIDNDTNWMNLTQRRANQIERYLNKRGVTNCIICNGIGFKARTHKIKNKIDEACENAIQIILTKSDTLHCYSLEAGEPLILNNIYFKTGNWDIQAESYNELNLFANYLLTNPEIKIEISGHTDNTGDYKKNIELSQKRADEVALYLKKKLVKNKIITKGYGSTKPIGNNNTDEGKAKNRRIEVKTIN